MDVTQTTNLQNAFIAYYAHFLAGRLTPFQKVIIIQVMNSKLMCSKFTS